MLLRFIILFTLLTNWIYLLAQDNHYETFEPIRDSLLSVQVGEYKLKGEAILIIIDKQNHIYSPFLILQDYKTKEGKKTLITYWHPNIGGFNHLKWFILDIDEVEHQYFAGENLLYLHILKKEKQNDEITENHKIIGKLDSFPEVIFTYTNWRWKYQDHELIGLDEGTLLNEKHFISYEDINDDGILDVIDKQVLQLYKPKDCSCENGVMPKIIEYRYIYKNAIFVPEDDSETGDD